MYATLSCKECRWPFCKVDILPPIHLSHGVPREVNDAGFDNNTTDGYPKISIDTVDILVKVWSHGDYFTYPRIILSFIKILSPTISGTPSTQHNMGALYTEPQVWKESTSMLPGPLRLHQECMWTLWLWIFSESETKCNIGIEPQTPALMIT